MSLLGRIREVQAGFRAARSIAAPPSIAVSGERVLIAYLFGGLGDAVLLAPAVAPLIDRGASVGLVLRPLAARIWRQIDLPVRIHVFSEQPIARPSYRIGVDLTFTRGVDTRAFLHASGCATRVGWLAEGETPEEAHLAWGTPDVRVQTDLHWSSYCALPLRCFGVERPAERVPWRGIAPSSRWPAGEGPKLLVVPGSQRGENQWPASSFAAVARRVNGARVVVTGAPWEAPLIKSIAREIAPGAAVFTGKDLAALLALVGSADAVLTNDTGPMHLAFSLGVPTVAVFNHMAPSSWGPLLPSPKQIVLRARGSESFTETVAESLLELLRDHEDV